LFTVIYAAPALGLAKFLPLPKLM